MCQFVHDFSSPGNSQANDAVEAAVKIAKRLLIKGKATDEIPTSGSVTPGTHRPNVSCTVLHSDFYSNASNDLTPSDPS